MGQKIDDFNIANIDAKAMSLSSGVGHGFGILSQNASGEIDNAGSDSGINTGYKYDKNNDKYRNVAADNFEEYLRDKNAKSREVVAEEESKEQEAKEAEKEIARSLSSEEINRLSMMGIDVENATMSDLMGVVSTMRGDAHREEMAKLMAQITLDMKNEDSILVSGGTVATANGNVELEGISVSDVIANEIESSTENNIANTTERNRDVSDLTDNKVNTFSIVKEDLLQIIKNNLPINEDNLYRVHFNGRRALENSISDETIKQMSSQIEGIIERAGYDVNEETMAVAKDFISNDIPLTTDNLVRYMKNSSFIGNDAVTVSNAKIEDTINIEEKAQKLYESVKFINSDAVYEMAVSGKSISIAAAAKYTEVYYRNSINNSNENNSLDIVAENVDYTSANNENLQAVTARRQMEEIRLSMTYQAATRLVKLDINIETRELSNVVKSLKDMENKQINNSLKNAGLEPTSENVEVYKSLSIEVNKLAFSHARVIAAPIMGEDFSVNSMNTFAAKFSVIEKSYEAVGTAPRYDMGDSIRKAFSNINELLGEMGIEATPETERATRILGYNSLEITEENISQVIEYDQEVNDLINNFYPEAVLGIIKDGINPLDMDIRELNKVVRNRNYNKGVSEASNFAAYLRDVERKEGITPEERESYIGIFRAMDKLAKSGDREAGWIFANEERLTVRNLIGAMRSRKATGLNVSIDDDFGMLQETTRRGKAIDAQIESAFNSAINNPQAESLLRENEIAENMVNFAAVNEMLQTPGGIHTLLNSLLENMHFDDMFKSNEVDDVTEDIEDSLMGEDKQINPIDFLDMDGILKVLSAELDNKRNTIAAGYEEINEAITEAMYTEAVQAGERIDIASIKMASAGLNILSKMARNDNYQIPIETSEGIRIMNLAIRQGNAYESRSIDISMDYEAYGIVRAKVSVTTAQSLSGYIVSSTSDGNNLLINNSAMVVSRLVTSGYNLDDLAIGSISSGKENTNNIEEIGDINKANANNNEERANDLYKAAVELVRVIGDVFK